MTTSKKILAGLDHKDYEHPFDKKALEALEKTPGLKKTGSFVVKHAVEKVYTVQFTGSNIKVTKNNYPRIYSLLEEACTILCLEKKPDLYLQWGYNINGFTTGADNPLIVLNSGLIDLCTDDEILYVIGHEIGHIKSMHMLYHMMAQCFSIIIDAIPGGGIIGAPLQLALCYWSRMSEFTADRAGLLCSQSIESSTKAMMKMAGVPIKHFSDINYRAFLDQAREFKTLDYNTMNKLIKFISIMDQSHPWTVMRSSELLKWINDGEYSKFVPSDPFFSKDSISAKTTSSVLIKM